MGTEMTFAEYMKSDDGKRAIEGVKLSQRKKDRTIRFLFVVISAAVFIQLILLFFPDDLWHNKTLTFLFLSGMGFSVAALVLVMFLAKRVGRRTQREEMYLHRAILLFWREHPIDWSLFAENGELFVAIEGEYETRRRFLFRSRLIFLTLSGRGQSVRLDLTFFCGAVDDFTAFLCCGLLPYLKARSNRGEGYRAVRFSEQKRGKNITGKKEGYLVKEGIVTKEGKKIFADAERVLSYL